VKRLMKWVFQAMDLGRLELAATVAVKRAMKWVFLAMAAAWAAAPAAAQLSGRPTRPQVVRPDGLVWQVIRKHCTSCHGIDDYAYSALDRPGWQSLIESKHKDGSAALSDDDRNTLLDWLVVRFGPNTKPFPRTYIPPEITTFFSDPEAKRLLDRACTSCHAVDRVEQARNPEERWRVIAVDMRERGAKLNDEELERLVEWLGRVWGTNQDK
jgi:mono/diheme cytochrome c family protein